MRREWHWQSPPQRIGRLRSEIVAAMVLLSVFVGVAALVQHLLGPAASDAGLAQTALSRFGAPPAQATVPPGQPALQFAGLYARGDGRREQVRTGVQGHRFQPGEAVRVTVTWQGSRTGSPVVTKTVGPLSAVADAAGDFSVDADFGDALPDLPNSALAARATGSRGSRATLYRLLGHE